MFDDVKSEIIESAETPDRDHEHDCHSPTKLRLNDQQHGRKNPDDQEKNTLELNPKRIG